MSDGFNLADAFSGGAPPSTTQNANQPQNPNWPNNPWGAYPGAPGGQQYPGYPAPGQQYPGAPGGGQQFPGFPAPGQPAPGAGQTFPAFPGAGQQFPGFGPGPGPAPTGPTAPQQPSAPSGPGAQQLSIPFEMPLHKGMMPRLLINVNGAVKSNPRRFTIDFKKRNDIAFHFNVRFDENPKVIVRNTMIRDSWGSEERQCHKFPFEAQKPFQIQFLVESDCFKVAVNGEPLVQFKHRVKELNEITTLAAYGDLTLNSVTPSMI